MEKKVNSIMELIASSDLEYTILDLLKIVCASASRIMDEKGQDRMIGEEVIYGPGVKFTIKIEGEKDE